MDRVLVIGVASRVVHGRLVSHEAILVESEEVCRLLAVARST